MTAQSSTRRFLKLAGMTANIAGKAVSRSLRTLGADEDAKLAARQKTLEDIGTQIADTLGQMKGAVMKVGQIASQYQDLFPPEVAKALGKLQRQAPPMPFEQIRKQVETELGQPLDRLLINEPDAMVADVMKREVLTLQALEDASEAAQAFERYDLVSAPVIDPHGRLIGRLTVAEVAAWVEGLKTGFHPFTSGWGKRAVVRGIAYWTRRELSGSSKFTTGRPSTLKERRVMRFV